MSKALATKQVAAVLLSLGLVLALSFAFVSTAKAQTVTTTTTTSSSLSTLQAQVQALLAQIAALQGSTTTTSGACFNFTENQTMGDSGGQVMWIQEFLNGHGFTVAASGAGSPGNESSYFGSLTQAAVIAFQNAYASSILTPVGLTSGTGYWGPSTRAEANALCASQTTTTTTTGTTTTGAGITISAATQPANSLAPYLANRVPFTTFTLTNNSGAAVTINGITVQRTGLAADAAFAGVELIDQNGVQIGTSRTFDSNNQATIGTPWTLQPGETETYTVAANMGTFAVEQNYAGQVASVSVIGVDTSVPVAGSLPITGASQTINSSLTIGSATVNVSSYDPNSYRSEPIGTTGLIFSGIRITAGSAEPEKLYSITWNQTGSIGSSDLSNLVTMVNGTAYPVTVDSTGKYFTSTFPGGISIAEGGSVDAYIQGDITGSDASGRSIEFDIYRGSDVYLVGQTYGYGITPVPTSVVAYTAQSSTVDHSQFTGTGTGSSIVSGTPFFEGSLTAVTAGTLSTVSSAGSVGSQNIAINVQNQPLGGFTTDFTGEPVTVQSMTFNVSSSTAGVQLQNVTLVDQNGNVVAGPVNETDSSATIVFNSSITFPVGVMTYTLEGTVAPTQDTTGTQTSTLTGLTYQLSTNPSNWTGAQGQVSGSTVALPDTVITLSTMTVQGGSLKISASATPAATTIAPGSNNMVIANIVLDASQSGEDIRLSSLPIIVDASSTDVATLKSDLTNCQLWNGTTALNTQAVGSGQWNTASSLNTSFAATGGGTGGNGISANFIFQNALTIPKGTTLTLSLECNISSSAYKGLQFAAGVDSGTSYLPSPTGVQSGNSLTANVTSSTSGVMTVGTANLVVTSPTPISYAQVSGGTTGVTVGTFTLQPSSDSVNLQYIGLRLNGNFASSSDISNVYVVNSSGTTVGTVNFNGVSPVGGVYYATSTITTGTNVPQNQQSVYTIKADVAQIGTGFSGTSGHEIKISLSDAQGVGASSGSTVNSGPAPIPTTGVAIFRSYPTVALNTSYLPSNGVSDGRLIAFSITANSNNPVGLSQLVFSFASSTGTTIATPTLYAYTDTGFSQPAGGTSNGGVVGTTAYLVGPQTATTTIATPLEIPAGNTWYFLLKGTVSLGSGTNNNISTTLKGDSTDLAPVMLSSYAATSSNNFVWSPNSTTTSAEGTNDWTNGFGVSSLPSFGITENRTN